MHAPQFLVIGASGYLGQQVTQMLPGTVTPTYCRAPKFPNSVAYDFYADDALPHTLTDDTTIIFTAAVEMNQPRAKLAAAMMRFLDQVSHHHLIYISSDAIFNGEQGNYTEDAEPTPVNDYGRNLVLCEQLVQEQCANYCIIRPSYIYGFVNNQLDARLSRTRDTLLRGETYTAYDDYFKCPLAVQEVADAVVCLATADYVGIMHVAGARMSAYTFQQQAMAALDIDTTNLRPESMPEQPGLMRDTSLDSSRWWQLKNAQPLPVAAVLANVAD